MSYTRPNASVHLIPTRVRARGHDEICFKDVGGGRYRRGMTMNRLLVKVGQETLEIVAVQFAIFAV